MKKEILCVLLVAAAFRAFGQSEGDTLKQIELKPVVVKDINYKEDIARLKPIQGTYIFSGMKNEVINVATMDANVAEKTGRQIFAKAPGVFVYDMDGSGNQINIATRGLDPHRGWEFNLRKDGVITNSDMYGYPASHYSMPMESIERIDMVRGTGSLQYGAQFGGMINYISKQPDTTKQVGFETINTIGSYGLFGSYNALSGKAGKFTYYLYASKRTADGFRKNAHTDNDAEQIMLTYSPSPNMHIKTEWARSNYVYRIPGPLTDSMFLADPQQATRSRNYFNPAINVPSISFDWKIREHTQLFFQTSAVLGARNSVLFDKLANIRDTINAATLAYNNRQVDIDHFNSYTSELRILQQYHLLKGLSSLAAGVQYMNNDLHRQQLGKGTTGSDFDLSLVQAGWGRDLHFKSQNVAVFLENNFKLLDNLSLSVGARMEIGSSKMSGVITYLPDSDVPNTIRRQFPLFGARIDYKIKGGHNFYAGWSQAYRPVIFKDIIPASVYEKSDKNLKDAYGYNLEVGYRGNMKWLKWDVNYFRVQYNNRLGSLALADASGITYIFRTNIGDALTNGAEVFIQADLSEQGKFRVSLFTSTAYMDSRYQHATVRSGNENIDISGNRVESTPQWISRNGLTIKYWKLSLTALYSYVDQSYADALNTEKPNATGSVGLVPAYGLLDINATLRVNRQITLKANINNVTNEQYFTKRPLFYPGPGIWPSDGRTVSFSVGVKI